MVSETWPVWDSSSAREPRVAVFGEGPVFWRLELLEEVEGRRFSGAGGASDFLVDQKRIEWSWEADKMREEGWCTARELTAIL